MMAEVIYANGYRYGNPTQHFDLPAINLLHHDLCFAVEFQNWLSEERPVYLLIQDVNKIQHEVTKALTKT